MKKTYIKPQALVYIIATRNQLLAGSNTSAPVSSENYDEGTMTDL